MATKRKKTKRGRPATGKTKAPWAARIAHDVIRYLRTQPSQAATVEALVRASEGYLRWRGAVVVPDHVSLPPEGN